jgi:hypothetical protein
VFDRLRARIRVDLDSEKNEFSEGQFVVGTLESALRKGERDATN